VEKGDGVIRLYVVSPEIFFMELFLWATATAIVLIAGSLSYFIVCKTPVADKVKCQGSITTQGDASFIFVAERNKPSAQARANGLKDKFF
jgi:hypothetical protein